MTTLETKGFIEAARALNEAGDRKLKAEVYAAFRKIAKPIGETSVREGSARMPHHGGLSARLARSKVSQSNSTAGRNPGVSIRLKSVDGYDLPAIDRGKLRHKVFGHKPWVVQNVPEKAFSTPFLREMPRAQREVLEALHRVASGIKGA